ncbi:MAG: 3'-5' exonuclease domain-containing protein 2 [Cytophagia bacterium]|nr:3'-5' exonuclease domain-containing protein 2 [Cytophagia bacterium]
MTGQNKLNEENFFTNSITHEEIQTLPLHAYKGHISVITDPVKLTRSLKEMEKAARLGFDTETRPAFVKGQRYNVALMQLATEERVWLIRLQQTGFIPALVEFLENTNVQKVGVGLRDDLNALQRLQPFSPGGFVELTQLTRQVGVEVESVKKLTGLLLGFRISKSAQTSNWEAPTLTEKQLEYAATDAWVCLQMYKKIEQRL